MFYLMDAMSPDFDRRGLSGMGERSTQHAATHCAYGNKGLACGILSGKVARTRSTTLWAIQRPTLATSIECARRLRTAASLERVKTCVLCWSRRKALE